MIVALLAESSSTNSDRKNTESKLTDEEKRVEIFPKLHRFRFGEISKS